MAAHCSLRRFAHSIAAQLLWPTPRELANSSWLKPGPKVSLMRLTRQQMDSMSVPRMSFFRFFQKI